MELMIGDRESDDGDAPNYYLIIAFGLGIAGFVLAHKSSSENQKLFGAGGCSVGAALFLLIFRFGFLRFYDLAEFEQYITVEYRAGWILALAAFAGAAACAFVAQSASGSSTAAYANGTYPMPNDSPPQGPYPQNAAPPARPMAPVQQNPQLISPPQQAVEANADKLRKLSKLNTMLNDKLISQAQYEDMKRKILSE